MRRARAAWLAFAVAIAVAAGGAARSEPARHTVIRLATAAPDGTAWARELRAIGRDVGAATKGAVEVKWFFGGIAGDERQLADRIRRGQLDGAASGGDLCQAISPTMRVVNVRGVFNSRDEASHVMNRFKSTIEAEFLENGFVYVAATGLGPDLVFSRSPIRTLDELRKTRIFHVSIDDRGLLLDNELGFNTVTGSLDEAGRMYEEGKVDGMIVNPSGALAFQWSSLVRYVLSLPIGYSYGCLAVSNRAFERLTLEEQQAFRAAGAKAGARIDEVGRQQDETLLGGVFQKQGIKLTQPADSMRSEFLAAARLARERLGDKLVPGATLQQVLAMLADYRSEHREAELPAPARETPGR